MGYNVDFLKSKFPILYEAAIEAEKHVYSAPRTSVFYSRYTVELAIRWLYANDKSIRMPLQDSLNELLMEQTFQQNLNSGMLYTLDYICRVGSKVLHSVEQYRVKKAHEVFSYLYDFLCWIYTYYGEAPLEDLKLDEILLQQHANIFTKEKTQEELKELEKDLQLKLKHSVIKELQRENEELCPSIEEIKAHNKQRADNVTFYTEAETRRLIINEMLEEAGWSKDFENITSEYRLEGLPTPSGLGYADDILWGADKKPLAVVESKKTSRSAKEGWSQARYYADALEIKFGQRPIIFLTNGLETYIAENKEDYFRKVHGFYTADQCIRIIQRRTKKLPLHDQPLNKDIAGRYYQMEAIRRTTEAFENGKRHALIVMATGTGKTRTVISLVDIITRSEWANKILFLADRRELVNQAATAFAEYLPTQPITNMLNDKYDTSANIYISTYKTMINSLEQRLPNGQKRFTVGSFDLIIIDEAHRSIYQKYGMLFKYFDSYIVGLTATPKADLDKNTYRIFKLEDNLPTYAYEYEKGVEENFLAPAVPIKVKTKYMHEGIKYSELSEEEKVQYEEEFTDPLTEEMPELIESNALNRWLFNEPTADSIWKVIMEQGIKVDGGDRIGKTIVFAKNHKHAEFLVDRFYKLYPHMPSEFTQIIDNYVRHAEGILQYFKQPDKFPIIAISVDMLDTGIDIQEILNLVIIKPVYSKAKFWQMIGRGTRICENLFGPNKDKEEFYVFDFCGNIEFFEAFPEGKESQTQVSVSQKIAESKTKLILTLGKESFRDDKLVQAHRQAMIEEMVQAVKALDKSHFTVRPVRLYVEKYENQEIWESLLNSEAREIINFITPLLILDDKEAIKRFDNLIYEIQLTFVEDKKIKNQQISRLREIGKHLETKRTIDEVRNNIELIRQIQKIDFYEGLTFPALEKVRNNLRNCIVYMDRATREPLYTDFQDSIIEHEVTLLPVQSSYQEYRKYIKTYLKKHESHVAIQKIRTNKQLTRQDLEELEQMIFQERPDTKREFQQHFGTEDSLIGLIRELLGMDVKAAKEAFAEFLEDKTLNANQIDFINVIIDFFVQNGRLDVKMLFQERPFTNYHQLGVMGLFPTQEKQQQLLRAVHAVNQIAQVT